MQAQLAPDTAGKFQRRRVAGADFHDAAFKHLGGCRRQRQHGAEG